MPTPKPRAGGGMKGFLSRASSSFMRLSFFAKSTSYDLACKLGSFSFIIGTTCLITLMPLAFEISREYAVLESEKLQVKDLREKGYNDNQIRSMGAFSDASIGENPAALLQK
uniref:Uncharacterized protein n=1 Tax=Corethron hystrix TaxID=216773 RepID=A0A7S1FVQ6_9STRA|eukprot:CAMPEP_0113311356 /NCGR_PEP_ID=MMETSP0010_2-20120614/8628_1 /TAXON_ID=216773 ORGANISM="Corethron hystrix, Strain 308" /NCGR_SAMPLE_ID=MMETSP0010_2 /ASSEMBLY_ACC=CAM_ASM_000155 /LENGTH=111 /DNA_ID=CAMNT_0000166983 /DNA_START=108 /DNA_END=443 /DNA_ORIENTATION=- /assembly_acc=CAM_ASM_000155